MADAATGHEGHGHRQPAAVSVAAHDLDEVLRDARQQFVGAFAEQCDSLAPPADQAGIAPLSAEDAATLLHRMKGLSGTVGFPRVSAKAAEFEDTLSAGAASRRDLFDGAAGLRAAFALDIAGPGPDVPSLQPAAAPMTVLLVEDEPVQRAITSAQLRTLGHTPVAVASGEEVIEAARKARPDVILLDVELPGINGYAVCRLLRADPGLAGIPVVFLSAHGADERLNGLRLGADDFLTKPLDPRELARRLLRLDGRGSV